MQDMHLTHVSVGGDMDHMPAARDVQQRHTSAAESSRRVLAESRPTALFLTEVASRTGIPAQEVAEAAAGSKGLLLVEHAAPDPHLQADLRILALVRGGEPGGALADARSAVDHVWTTWLREALSHHRCG